jgi:hypothetical protein
MPGCSGSSMQNEKNTHGYMTVWYTKGIYVSFVNCFVVTTSPLLALFTCCWMSFEAVLGNTEFELVVFGVTFAVATRRSASEHAVSVFKCR